MKKSIKIFEVKAKTIAKEDTKKIKGGSDPIIIEDIVNSFIGIEDLSNG